MNKKQYEGKKIINNPNNPNDITDIIIRAVIKWKYIIINSKFDFENKSNPKNYKQFSKNQWENSHLITVKTKQDLMAVKEYILEKRNYEMNNKWLIYIKNIIKWFKWLFSFNNLIWLSIFISVLVLSFFLMKDLLNKYVNYEVSNLIVDKVPTEVSLSVFTEWFNEEWKNIKLEDKYNIDLLKNTTNNFYSLWFNDKLFQISQDEEALDAWLISSKKSSNWSITWLYTHNNYFRKGNPWKFLYDHVKEWDIITLNGNIEYRVSKREKFNINTMQEKLVLEKNVDVLFFTCHPEDLNKFREVFFLEKIKEEENNFIN